MKKSSLLSLLTAAAIVTTSAGTFAAWDTLDASKNVELTYGKPVTVTMTDLVAPSALGGIDGATEVVVDVPVQIKQDSNDYTGLSGKKVTLEAKGSTNVDVAFYENDGTTPVASGVDTTPEASKTYKAKITLADPDTVLTTNDTLTITATLSK